jgi:hypothetical protein
MHADHARGDPVAAVADADELGAALVDDEIGQADPHERDQRGVDSRDAQQSDRADVHKSDPSFVAAAVSASQRYRKRNALKAPPPPLAERLNHGA